MKENIQTFKIRPNNLKNSRITKQIYNISVPADQEFIKCIKEELNQLNIQTIIKKTLEDLTSDEMKKIKRYSYLNNLLSVFSKYINHELLLNSKETNIIEGFMSQPIERYMKSLLTQEEKKQISKIQEIYKDLTPEELEMYLKFKYSKENYEKLTILECYTLIKLSEKYHNFKSKEWLEAYEKERIRKANEFSRIRKNIDIYN